MTNPNSVRDRNVKPLFARKRGAFNTATVSDELTENAYWEGNLSAVNKHIIEGYDMAVEHINSLFNNLNAFAEEFMSVGVMMNRIDDLKLCSPPPFVEGSSDINPDYKDLDSYTPEQQADMSRETLLFLALKSVINEWLEGERNETVTAMLDSDLSHLDDPLESIE